ncbi:hypothetical protein Bbelb_241740 [Branchiostoma belcheri]|nr:hypothetical protein Bbelb_241740 [Branchiostoma belcheri]
MTLTRVREEGSEEGEAEGGEVTEQNYDQSETGEEYSPSTGVREGGADVVRNYDVAEIGENPASTETCQGLSSFDHFPRTDCGAAPVDIASHRGVTLQFCAAACCAEPTCLSFQYSTRNRCYLKNKICSAEEKNYDSIGNMYDRLVLPATLEIMKILQLFKIGILKLYPARNRQLYKPVPWRITSTLPKQDSASPTTARHEAWHVGTLIRVTAAAWIMKKETPFRERVL